MRAVSVLLLLVGVLAVVQGARFAIDTEVDVDVDINQEVTVESDVPTGPNAVPAKKVDSLYVALHTDEVIRGDHIRCLKRKGVTNVAIRSSSNFVDNAAKLASHGLKVDAFYSPHDLDSQRSYFFKELKQTNVSRVWIRLTNAKLHDVEAKNYAYIVSLADKLAAKNVKVGIYSSRKSWNRLFGKEQTAGALANLPLWLTGSQNKNQIKRLVKAINEKFSKKATIVDPTLLEQDPTAASNGTTPNKRRNRKNYKKGKKQRKPHIIPADAVGAPAAAAAKPAASKKSGIDSSNWAPTLVRKQLVGKDGTVRVGVCHLDAEAAVRNEAAPSKAKVGAGSTSVVAAALALTGKGTKYLYGGDGKNGRGIDCSHFVNTVYANAGRVYPYTTTGAWPPKQFTRTNSPQPGDVIMFKGHMAIYQDSTHMIGSQSSTGPAVAACPGPYWGKAGKAPITGYYTWA